MDRPSFPGFGKLYLLRESRLAFSAQHRGEPLSLDEDRLLVRAEYQSSEPIEFAHNLGKVPLDLVYGSVGVYLISPAAARVFADAGLTGWTTFPANLFGRDRQLVTGYAGLAVLGRCGPIQVDRAQRMRRTSPSGAPYLAKVGLFFDEATWSGDDFVVPSTGPTYIIVSDAVRAAASKAQLRNMKFESLSEFEHFELTTDWLDPPQGILDQG